jgi:Amt family ammonium transporter
MLFIQYVLRVPLRMSDADCLIGDDAIHGESAYTFGEELSTLHGMTPKVADEEAGGSDTAVVPSGSEIGKEVKQS